MEHATPDIVIKKATMIKKNFNDINSVYRIEKGVTSFSISKSLRGIA